MPDEKDAIIRALQDDLIHLWQITEMDDGCGTCDRIRQAVNTWRIDREREMAQRIARELQMKK